MAWMRLAGYLHMNDLFLGILCILHSILFSFMCHITTTLVEINCPSADSLAQVHTHQGSLRQLTKAFFP